MSETIICRTCNTENPLGSKYCNNCGTVLPPSTSIICPNCQTPNPRNRLYCDECGTKLVKEATPSSKPTEEQPSVKRFDLPSRPPGETSQLDPATLPDWLRTGEHDWDAESDDLPSDETDIPEVTTDAGLRHVTSDELPAWLVEGEDDIDDFFDVPREITTDHFLELVQESGSGEADDSTSDYDDEATSSTSPPADEERNWLDELGPPQTGVFIDLDDPQDTFNPTAALPNLPDWLTDIGPAYTGQLGSDLAAPGDSDDDWLDDFKPAYSGELADTDAPFDLDEFAFTGPLDEGAVEEGDLPDWLLDLRPEDSSDIDELEADEKIAGDEEPWEEIFDEDESLEESGFLEEIGFLEKREFPDDSESFDDGPAFDDAQPSDDMDLLVPDTEDEEEVDQEEDRPQLGDSPELSEATELDWLVELASAPPKTDTTVALEDAMAEDNLSETDSPDFVTAPAGADLGDSDHPLADWIASDEIDGSEETGILEPLFFDDDDETVVASELDSEAFDLESLGEVDEIPDWISQLGSPSAQTGVTDQVGFNQEAELLARNEDLPEWIANMMPDKDDKDREGLTLSGLALVDPDYVDPLEGLPEELASDDLPDWLGDAPAPRETGPLRSRPDQTTPDIPVWLQQVTEDEDSAKLSAELSSLLGPPTRDKKPELRKAEIPEWLQALKPTELTEAAPETSKESYVTTTGPLSGISGALEIEPLIARPRSEMGSLLPFTISTEQQKQAELLQQVIATETEAQPVATLRHISALSVSARSALALLLLLAILFGLWGPGIFASTVAPSPAVLALHMAVEGAAGQPVLLVFDYTPGLAGELDPQAALLLQQLASNGSPVVTVSQYTAGERLAALQSAVSHPDNHIHIGYLPGEAVGVRQLGYCLAAGPLCEGLVTRPLTAAERESLAAVSLVIILTGERDNLVNWIEQLAVYDQLTLAAGVTQSLRPIAAPYVASGQLEGLLSGMPDTAAYQTSLLGQAPDNGLTQQQNAQAAAQLVAALLLLTGLIIYVRRT
jgi:hypothetical protein